MPNPIIEDIIKVLKKLLTVLDSEDYAQIKQLSNATVHNASIFQDQDSISIAVIIYSLGKILEREGTKHLPQIKKTLAKTITYLEAGKIHEYKDCIKKLFARIAQLDEKFRQYIGEVVQHAEVKKGSRLYEHGISMARAAELLGITEWELSSYVGKTRIIDMEEMPEISRLSIVRKLFRKKKK